MRAAPSSGGRRALQCGVCGRQQSMKGRATVVRARRVGVASQAPRHVVCHALDRIYECPRYDTVLLGCAPQPTMRPSKTPFNGVHKRQLTVCDTGHSDAHDGTCRIRLQRFLLRVGLLWCHNLGWGGALLPHPEQVAASCSCT